MKRLIVALIPLSLSLACSSQPNKTTSLTGPTVAENIVYDSSVAWDSTQVGRVTVYNPRSTPLTLTFMLWNRITEFNQVSIGAAVYMIQPKATMVLTVGASLPCGPGFQRDLYEGSFKVGVTLNEVGNALYAADAHVWPASARPPPPPPYVPPTDPPCKHYGRKTLKPPCKKS